MTKHIETKLEHLLTNSHKTEMIAYMESHPEDFTEAIKLANRRQTTIFLESFMAIVELYGQK